MGANAQTSVPAFTAGQVLTAAQVTQINTGIPVFASSTERDAAFGGTGEKTLAEGQYAFLEDTNETQVYDGSSWAAVGASGLVLVSRTTVGSAVSSVTVSNAFSADYDAYRVIMTGGAASATPDLRLTLGASSTGYYYGLIIRTYAGSSVGAELANGAYIQVGASSPQSHYVMLDLTNPFAAKETVMTGLLGYSHTGGAGGFVGGYHAVATSYTDFTITPSTGTLTGGTIDVYGYAKA